MAKSLKVLLKEKKRYKDNTSKKKRIYVYEIDKFDRTFKRVRTERYSKEQLPAQTIGKIYVSLKPKTDDDGKAILSHYDFLNAGKSFPGKTNDIIKRYYGKINSKADIKSFYHDMFFTLGINIHPDDSFADVVSMDNNKEMFSKEQAKKLDKITSDIFEYAGKHDIDVYEISLKEIQTAMKKNTSSKKFETGGSVSDGRYLPDEYYKEFQVKGYGRKKFNMFKIQARQNPKESAKKLFPDFTYEQHLERAKEYSKKMKDANRDYDQAVQKRFKEHFGRPIEFTDYKVSGVVRDEFSNEVKDELRGLLTKANRYSDVLHLHNSMLKKADQQDTKEFQKGGDVVNSGNNFGNHDIDEILKHYKAAALWSSDYYPEAEEGEDSDPIPFNQDYTIHDFNEKTEAGMRADIEKFVSENVELLKESGLSDENIGHTFWLNRNGHGSGFFDYGQGEVFDKLSDAAREFGETNLDVNDQNKIVVLQYLQEGGTLELQDSVYARGGKINDRQFTTSNLILKGFGRDANGNSTVIVSFPNDRGFSIQTNNGSLAKTHSIKTSGVKVSDLTPEQMVQIEKEVNDYVKNYGSDKQKANLKIYKKLKQIPAGAKEIFTIAAYDEDDDGIDLMPYTSTSYSSEEEAVENGKKLLRENPGYTAFIHVGEYKTPSGDILGDVTFSYQVELDDEFVKGVNLNNLSQINFEDGRLVIKENDIPDDIYDSLYKINRWFVDTDLIIQPQTDGSYKVIPAIKSDYAMNIERGVDGEDEIYNYIHNLYTINAASGGVQFAKGGDANQSIMNSADNVNQAAAGESFAKGGKLTSSVKYITGNVESIQKDVVIGISEYNEIVLLDIQNDPDKYFSISGHTVEAYTVAQAKRYAKQNWENFFEDEPEQLQEMNERMGKKFRSSSAAAQYVLDVDGELHGFDQYPQGLEVEYKGSTWIFMFSSSGQLRETLKTLKHSYIDNDTLTKIQELWEKYGLQKINLDVEIPIIEQDKEAVLKDAIARTRVKKAWGGPAIEGAGDVTQPIYEDGGEIPESEDSMLTFEQWINLPENKWRLQKQELIDQIISAGQDGVDIRAVVRKYGANFTHDAINYIEERYRSGHGMRFSMMKGILNGLRINEGYADGGEVGSKSYDNRDKYDDFIYADEIESFYNQDGDLYRQIKVPIIRNLKRKMDKGTYDHAKAIRVWRNFVDFGVKKYMKEHGSGTQGYAISVNDRNLLAEALADFYEAEYKVNKLEGYADGGVIHPESEGVLLPDDATQDMVFKQGGQVRIANRDARAYVENRIEFKGSNLEGKKTDDGNYLVLSYGYYPIYFYNEQEQKWYGNQDKPNVSTAMHMSAARPGYNVEMLPDKDLDAKMLPESAKFAFGGITDLAPLAIQQQYPMTTDNTTIAHSGARNTEM